MVCVSSGQVGNMEDGQRCSQLILRSSQSCLLVFRDFLGASCWGTSPPADSPSATDGRGPGARKLGYAPPSLCTLNPLIILRPSSSIVPTSDMVGARELMLFFLLAGLFICWISYVILSVLRASRMLVVAVGRRARTVKVQSSWFCSKRRRKLSIRGFRG